MMYDIRYNSKHALEDYTDGEDEICTAAEPLVEPLRSCDKPFGGERKAGGRLKCSRSQRKTLTRRATGAGLGLSRDGARQDSASSMDSDHI